MSERWALRLAKREAGSLGSLRLVPGVQVCDQDGEVWLRGERADDSLRRRLLVLPESCLFAVLDGGEIVPHGARVPVGRLPEGQWQALPRWLSVILEPAALSGRIEERAGLRMVPAVVEREANVLLTSLQAWVAYAADAPQVRLQRWRFAVTSSPLAPVFGGEGLGVRGFEGVMQSTPSPPTPLLRKAGGEGSRVAIHGTPLPPLPGRMFCETDGVAAQAGWTWTPAVEARIVRQVLGLAKGDLALLHADGSWEHLRAGGFVAATRSAVRLTLGGQDDGR